MTEEIKQPGIISDADVLIDYAESAPNVLRLISTHIRKLYVALPVLKEVDQLNQVNVEKLGIEIIEPKVPQLVEAAAIIQDKPSLSGQDALCFIMARDNNWSCLTNDKKLRQFCSENKIACLWGIGIMRQLVSAGKLTPEKAIRVAQDIESKNKRITPEVIDKFMKQLGL